MYFHTHHIILVFRLDINLGRKVISFLLKFRFSLSFKLTSYILVVLRKRRKVESSYSLCNIFFHRYEEEKEQTSSNIYRKIPSALPTERYVNKRSSGDWRHLAKTDSAMHGTTSPCMKQNTGSCKWEACCWLASLRQKRPALTNRIGATPGFRSDDKTAHWQKGFPKCLFGIRKDGLG